MAKDFNAPTLTERALFLFSPKRGDERYLKRMEDMQRRGLNPRVPRSPAPPRPGDAKRDGAKMAGAYYSAHAASEKLTSLAGWIAPGGSAEDDIDKNGAILRARARDLYAGGGLARSGVDTLTTNVVGWGIQPKPKIDRAALGMTDEAADEWERAAAREFKLWAENPMCDAEQAKDFYAIQRLAFLSALMSGDVFALFLMRENKRTPYQTAIRLLEADRVSTPDSQPGESTSAAVDGGGRIVDGIEIDADGRVVRYHIASHHPLAENSEDEATWDAVDAYGADTGYPNVLHVMTYERPEQRRGVPFVAAQIEQIKQLDRYQNSELAANVVSSMLTAFLESADDDGKAGMEDAIDASEKVTDDELKLELAPGAIYDLPPGKKIATVNPIRNNSAFEAFVTACQTAIGASMGIPKEVLIKKYDSNYTAARSAMLDFWKTVRVHRNAFNRQFNQPIYEQWLAEAVAAGRLDAPGFFEDPAIRQAWCGCLWTGISMGHVDPLKEVNAAERRIALNISTEEQEASEYNGGDWDANVRQRKKEIAALRDVTQDGTTQSGTTQSGGDDTEDEEEDENA